jgi:hypothetical protein
VQPRIEQEPSPQVEACPKDFGDPILNLIGEDILFFARRNYSADRAADAITDILDEKNIGIEELRSHFAEWTASGDWFENLAARGLDLRQNRSWAEQVFFGVIERLSAEVDDNNDNPEGGSGSEGDA